MYLLTLASVKALQDHDYMEGRSKSTRDPFLASGEYLVDNYILNCNIDKILATDKELKLEDSLTSWEDKSSSVYESICGTRSHNLARTWYRGFRERVFLAAIGGAFLIGPMWVMVLRPEVYTSLIVTTALVTGFGVLMAYFLEHGKDVLASTAAYAAVLVVFVGTSSPGLE